MRRIYADNAATTFPKPDEVSEAVCHFINNVGANAGRGTYENSFNAGRVIYETRELICELFNFNNPFNVVFTQNITQSLNIILKGMLKSGDHVIISSMEHNSVLRPLKRLEQLGVEITIVRCENNGTLEPGKVEKHIKSNTNLVVMTHASNVCGTILPIYEIGQICKKYNIHFLLDSAQSAGSLKIDFNKFNLSALAFTGHKGLLGPQGIGGFILNEELSKIVSPLIEGGTGSFSDLELQPELMPDKFEAGTLNIPGIYGLNASLKFIMKKGLDEINKIEEKLSYRFIENISNVKGINLIGINDIRGRTPVFSLDFTAHDNSEAAVLLEKEFGIMTRVGLHCAPLAHKTLGTYPKGTVRFSFGVFNTEEEMNYVSDSIKKTITLLNNC